MTTPKNKLNKNIFLFVGSVAQASINAIREYNTDNRKNYRIALILDTKNTTIQNKVLKELDFVIRCNLSLSSSIKKALKPYTEEIVSVTARGEKNIPHLQQVIPFLPNAKLPSVEALHLTTNKTAMRKRLASKAPGISPRFMSAKDPSKKTVDSIAKKVRFPLIVKPAGLASSLLISMCYDKEELSSALKNIFSKIKKVYKEVEGRGEPEVLAEEFMEGDVFSIDVYIQDIKTMFFCPIVHAKNGRSVGFDDFFEYSLSTPTSLKKEKIEDAQKVARQAIEVLGLTYLTAHVELMNTEKGWKVVEIGPRIGGYRPKMYELSFGFKHSINDLLVRMPQKPLLKNKVLAHTTVLRFYPEKEGVIETIKGIRKIKSFDSFDSMIQNLRKGDISKHSKNGGKAVFYIYLSHKDKSSLLADIRRVEQTVKIITK